VLINANIHANTSGGMSIAHGAHANVVTGAIANNGGDGIDITDAAVSFNTNYLGSASPMAVTANSGDGIYIDSGILDIDQANIQSNVGGGPNNNAGWGIEADDGATVKVGAGTIASNSGGGINMDNGTVVYVEGTTISDNAGGPALQAPYSTAYLKSSTVSVPSTLGQPAILAYHSALQLKSSMVTGPGDANTLAALGGSTVLLYQTSITASDAKDATVLASDGSTVDSVGGNTIQNAAAVDPAITISNASTFHESANSVLAHYFTPSADTIRGTGTVQVQSNLELGTGTTASSWIGNITVLQNSSVRLDGGLTVTGSVILSQGSNGFFNKSSGGSNNSVTATVMCLGTDSSHVAGQTFVTPPVTLVTTGVGCYAF
jgi:hypothetical protein